MVLDAVVGKAVEELLKAVMEMKEKADKYKPTLERLENTLLQSTGKVINQIQELNKKLDRPEEEMERLIDQMKSGRELVLKCSVKVKPWNLYYKARYQKKLEELNESISKFFALDMQAQNTRNGLETLVLVKEIHDQGLPMINQRVELRGVVCSPPEPPAFTVGLDVPLNELKLWLLRDEVSVSVLTLTGSGGSGKTTLAKKFCSDNQVKGKFKDNIFFVTFAETPKLNTIVQKLYQHTGYQMPELQSPKDAVNQFEHLMKHIGKKGPILLVLHDVWPGSESLVENFVFEIPNYKILVTSRFAIRRFKHLYVLKPLGEPDAIKLFRHSASLNQSSSVIPDDVVKQIVRGCSGSPLALRVSGRSLSHQPPVVWLNRAIELSTGHSILDSDRDVLSCLQKNLNLLDDKVKECFGDLGLFPQDQRIPATALVDIWAELRNENDASSMKKIYDLVDLNMANVIVTREVASDTVDYHYHYVTQYGLLRELAIRQTSQEPVDKRNRLIVEINGNKLPTWWTDTVEYHIEARILSISTDETFNSEWCNLQPTEVEALVLNLRGKKYTLPMFMKKMNKLKVLIITNYDFYRAELENFEMLDHLSDLRRIRLERVSIPFLSKTGVQLKNLQKCSFFMCNVNEAFKNCTVQDSNMMPKLVEMSFDYCNMVELPIVLSNIVSLKKLSITICHDLLALPEEIGKLENLESLRVSSCSSLLELPDSITKLHNLKFLDISNCISLGKLPDNMGKLGKLEKLNVRGCSRISEFVLSSIIDLESLKHVVCDEETATLLEPMKTFRSDLRLEVAADDFNLGFLYSLQSLLVTHGIGW